MLGDRIRELRTEQGLSQRALADKLQVTQQAVARWEGGKTEPDSRTLSALATELGCSVDYLLGRTDAVRLLTTAELPPTITAYGLEGLHELPLEAQESIREFIEFVRQKHGKDGKGGKRGE